MPIRNSDTVVETKSRFGDLEVDAIIGKNHKQAILTIVDKKTNRKIGYNTYDLKFRENFA